MDKDILELHLMLQQGICCSKALVKLGSKCRGYTDPLMETVSAALCKGVRGGLTCGALSGAAMVLAMFDEELAVSDMIPALTEWFLDFAEDRYGGTDCRTILSGACGPAVCPSLVEEVWKKAKEILEDEGFLVELNEE